MLCYDKSYTGLVAATDEIPIADNFEEVLAQALIVEAMDKSTKAFANEYLLYQNMIDDLDRDNFTPNAGSCRPKPRFLPGYSGCFSTDDSEYIGEE
jgi:hypothetical protein